MYSSVDQNRIHLTVRCYYVILCLFLTVDSNLHRNFLALILT
jgi:hypothetical protein